MYRIPGSRLIEPPAHVTTAAVLREVGDERQRQLARWGEQNHLNGTGRRPEARLMADSARILRHDASHRGRLTWRHILDEEFHEALAAPDPAALRVELLQVAAVAVAWVEALDRRSMAAAPNPPAVQP